MFGMATPIKDKKMSALFDEYKKKFLNYFKKDQRFECKLMLETENSCMLYIDVKKNGKREGIKLRDDEITFWLAGNKVIEKMTEKGFKRFIEEWGNYVESKFYLSECNSDGKELGTFVWFNEKGLSEKEIIDFWYRQPIQIREKERDVHYLVYETFFGDVKFRFKRENDGWVRIE
jgi:hypothetical protein